MVDSSYEKDQPFVFNLESGKAIKGWDVAIKTMAKGEKARVTLSPKYGYGLTGAPPNIPPNAKLIFEMELLKWQSNRDVFGDQLVIKSQIKAGEGWERPRYNAEVTVDVVAREKEDKNSKVLFKGRKVITIGKKEAPEAWDAVLKEMKKGGRMEVVCKGKYVGGPGVDFVPKDAEVVVYDITLVNWLKVEDLCGDGGVMKKIIKEGEGWERPNEGATVVADLTYSVYDAEKRKPKPLYDTRDGVKLRIGDGEVVDGLDKALSSMKKGEEAEVILKPEYGYENAKSLLPRSGEVKATDTIHVAVKLVSFEKAKDMWSMTFDEKAQEMRKIKEKGNQMFKDNRLKLAMKCYERGISFFDSSTSELNAELRKKVNHLLVQCHLNVAACQEKLSDYKKVIEHCNKALDLEPSNGKALYRRGSAYLALDDYYKARVDLKYALEMNGKDANIRKKLKELVQKQAKQDAVDKKLYSNLFGRLSKMEAREKAKAPADIANGTKSTEEEKTSKENGVKEDGAGKEDAKMEVDAKADKAKAAETAT